MPTYPGVYIEELPSQVRTITGVATSITAFVGRGLRGPVNEPVTVNNFGDYERTFGGLWTESSMGFAVRDFFQNGGGQAIIVRLFHPYFATEQEYNEALDAATDVANAAAAAEAGGATAAGVAAAARTEADLAANATEPRHTAADTVAVAAEAETARTGATPTSVKQAAANAVVRAAPLTNARISVGSLNFEAANEGAWGNKLSVTIDHSVRPGDTDSFNLSIKDNGTKEEEVIRNVTVLSNNERRVDRVLEQESRLVRVRGTLPASRPSAGTGTVSGAGMASDGSELTIQDYDASLTNKTGIYALEKADLFNLLCIPPFSPATDVDKDLWSKAATYCAKRRAILLVDAPRGWKTVDHAKTKLDSEVALTHENAALFFPRLVQPNPLASGYLEMFAPCGAVAGVFARTDAQRGVWKAPAGLDATLMGVPQLSVILTDAENGMLNPLGINCLRAMPPAGRVVWGARTRKGDDRLADQWKYIPVRRLALLIEESLYRGTQWVVFEPNDEPLWAQIRLNAGAFMHSLYRQGAFQGSTPSQAYFVKCDKETTTQDDINRGIVNILVGFAPLKPAEFVIIKISQMAGQVPT